MRSSETLTIFTFLAVAVVSSFAHFGSPSPAPAPLATSSDPTTRIIGSSLKEWCNSTDYPDVCETAIAPFMNGKPDLFQAVDIGTKSAVTATNTAILAAAKIANLPLIPQELATILKDALDRFNDALDNYKEGQNALQTRDWGTYNIMLSGAISNFGDIEDMIKKEDVPMLKGSIDKLTKMTSNCLALSALIEPPPGYFF